METELEATNRSTLAVHLALILTASIAFETLFIHYGINIVDEGWPLYAAMQLHAGAALYTDVFFVFPPGHLLPAWLAYALDPPGLVLSREIYAAFTVALCVTLYLLGRRVMPPGFALLGALLLAFCAPRSHAHHYLFAYRYLVWSALSLLAFGVRLRGGSAFWSTVAGGLAGVSLCFRLTPGFAVICGLGVGVACMRGRWSTRAQEGLRLAAGFSIVVLPVALWLAISVGPETLWRELVIRPLEMTRLQSMPVPELIWPTRWSRSSITRGFVPLMFRLAPLLYAGHVLALIQRARKTGRSADQALLAAVVTWGAVFFARSMGRSDGAHLDSALPPVCLLLAQGLWSVLSRARADGTRAARVPLLSRAAAGLLLLCVWVLAQGSDRMVREVRLARGQLGDGPTETWLLSPDGLALEIETQVASIRKQSEPGERILDVTASPLFYVLSGRLGPGGKDVVMPGTFLDEAEERAFLEHLRADPPALVLASSRAFDQNAAFELHRFAPSLVAFVKRNYYLDPESSSGTFAVLARKSAAFDP